MRLRRHSSYTTQGGNKMPKVLTAREIFRKVYPNGGKNFMTPNILSVGKINKMVAYELSSGRGIFTDTIYGVTVVGVNPKNNKPMKFHNLSKAFDTRKKAELYINRLKKRMGKR